ncbi:hypothetical protein OC835_007823 [Tilletia horrida]|nr:hypothetical protein OC835_007823 [Tilletia horrida]
MALNAAANLAERIATAVPTTTTKGANPADDPRTLADPSGETMRALVWLGPNHVQIQDVPKPRVVGEDDAVLEITGTTVCGSDLHLYHGALLEMTKGFILGHEFCGRVASLGPKAQAEGKLKQGQRVVVSFQIACGDCKFCKQKLSSQCLRTNSSKVESKLYGQRTAGMFGYSHLTGFAGGQAEYVRVPHASVNCLPIPDGIPDEKALYLSDVLPTSYHCVADTGVKEGDTVGIWGAGPIGIFAAKWSLLKGAKRVIFVDKRERLALAKQKIPQAELLDYEAHKDVPARILELTKGRGIEAGEAPGLDVALECAAGEYAKSLLHKAQLATGLETDTPEIISECILSTKSFGRVGITGIYAGLTNGFNVGAAMERGIRLIFNGQAPVHKYWVELLETIERGEIDPLELIVSHRIDLEEVPLCYRLQDEHKRGIIKPFVQTRFSDPPAPGAPQTQTLKA